jgi:hypothetical protein
LKDGARIHLKNRVPDLSGQRVRVQEAPQNISHNDKQVRGQRIPLPESFLTVNPFAWVSIQQYSSFTGD